MFRIHHYERIELTNLVLLFILTPAAIIPYFDRLHSTMLFWLAPSQQIRPPIYSFRQRSQRRKIVFKCELTLQNMQNLKLIYQRLNRVLPRTRLSCGTYRLTLDLQRCAQIHTEEYTFRSCHLDILKFPFSVAFSHESLPYIYHLIPPFLLS